MHESLTGTQNLVLIGQLLDLSTRRGRGPLLLIRIVTQQTAGAHRDATVADVRTTVDLPDDVHRVALAIARDAGTSLSETVTQLLRAALGTAGTVQVSTSSRTGLRVVTTGRVATSEDVRQLDDE